MLQRRSRAQAGAKALQMGWSICPGSRRPGHCVASRAYTRLVGEVVELRQRIATPLYTVSDAARYAHVARSTLKNWAEGYQAGRGKWYPPLLMLPEEQPFDQTALTFENLIEAALIGHWRRRGIPLQRIRRAHFLALEELGDHPFARNRIY